MALTDDSLEVYRNNLRHVVRPEESSDRAESTSIVLTNWEALAVVEGLREYAAYHAPNSERSEIAIAYIEYAQMVVHEERKSSVQFFAHTEEARRVLTDGVTHVNSPELADTLNERVMLYVWNADA